MSASNGHHTQATAGAVSAARPVVLVRYRPASAADTARVVHLMPLPEGGKPDAASALCGTVLRAEEIETATSGHGAPCNLCLLNHTIATTPDTPTGTPKTASPRRAGPAPIRGRRRPG